MNTDVPLARKLGAKPGLLLAWHGEPVMEIEGVEWSDQPPCDVLLFRAETRADLETLSEAIQHWEAKACWVVYPKGKSVIRQADVFEFGLATGWVDNKVCSVDATYTGLRFVPRKVPKS